MAPRHLVVFGGGISGLTTAFYCAKSLPKSTRITVVEKSHRLGGWIRSLPIANSKIALEAGPRTFRAMAAPYSLIRLIEDLNLQGHIIATPLGSPAGHMRYVYLENEQDPGLPGDLALVPATPLHLPLSSHFRWMARPLIGEFWKEPNTPKDYDDESIDAIISRRFSPEIARQLVSAVIHGIYAADSRELSVKSTLPILTHAEREGEGHILAGIWPALVKRKQMQMAKREQEGDAGRKTTALDNLLANAATFSFVGGLEMVPRTLEERLSEMGNVRVLTGNGVASVEKENGDFKIKLEDESILDASHVVSTLPLPTLYNIMSSSSAYKTTPLPQLLSNPHTSVQVLNLVFPPSPTPLHPPGFGFLVPRPQNDYPSTAIAPPRPTHRSMAPILGESVLSTGMTPPLLQNVLGTAFDSSVDPTHDHRTQPTIMTMMLGGPFPLFQPSSSPSSSASSTESSTSSQQLSESDLEMVLRTLGFYLGAEEPLPQPTFHVLHTHRNCIPTYKPGSSRILYEMKRAAREGAWGSRFKIIGGGAGHGISLADNITLARSVALRRDED